MLHRQAPRLRIQVAAALPLKGTEFVSNLRRACSLRKIREVRFCLLVRGLQGEREGVARIIRRRIHCYPERVAFQPGVQVVVLRRTVINAKTGTENGFPMKRTWRPCHCEPGIKILVVWIVKSRIGWTGWSVDRAGTRRDIKRARPKADAMK